MIFLQKLKYMALCATLIATCIVPLQTSWAQSEDSADGLIPQTTVSVDAQLSANEETHPPLRLTPDKSEIIELDQTINRVVVGNEVHANVMLDSSKRLVVVPRVPGATFFSVMDKDGNVIMQRHIIVANPKEKYVRIREPCRGLEACMPVRMFYCPGMCHEIAILGEDGTSFSGSIAAAEEEERPTLPLEFTYPGGEGE